MTPLITFKDTGYTIRGFLGRHSTKIFSSLNFEVLAGETLGVIGNNGAGKSTLLKLMSGVYKPTSGSVELSPETNVALLSLKATTDKTLSGYHNAILFLMYYGLNRKTAESLIPEIIEFSELGKKFYNPVYTYSSGMQARLTFSCAQAIKPEVILIDEMLGVGDKNFRAKSTEAIMNKISGDVSVVLVSHNLDTVESICDRVLWLHKGKIKMLGDPEKVIQAYEAS